MKRIMALLLVTSMLLSAVTVTVGASEATTEIANFDIDSLELENGGDIIGASMVVNSKPSGYFSYNESAYFLYVRRNSASNVGITAYGEKGIDNQSAKISFSADAYYWTNFNMLKNDLTANRGNDAAITARTSDVAYSFDIKMNEGINLKMTAKGLPSTATSVKGDDGEYITTYLTSTLFEIANGTGTTLKTNSYTKDTTDSPVAATYTDKFARGENVNFKVIVDYDEGTFDLYVNNHLVAADNGLAGTKFLSDFALQIEHNKAFGAAETYVDNLSYRILSDNDLKQVYLSNDIENGTLILNETFTEVGKPITFTATPDEGCKLTSLTLDGKEIAGLSFTGNGGTYTIESLPHGGELKAVFEEKRITTKVADFDVDSLEADVGTNLNTLNTGATNSDTNYSFNYNDNNYFMNVTASNASATVAQDTGNDVVEVKKVDTTSQGVITFTFLKTGLSANVDEQQVLCRESDVAFSFKLKLPEQCKMEIYTGGQLSTDETASTKVAGTSKIIHLNNWTLPALTVYDYTKDTTTNTYATYGNCFVRDEWAEFKILYDYSEGTYDLYVNNKLIAEDQGLAYPKFLLNFFFKIYLRTGASYNPTVSIDDVQFYTVADADNKVQPNVSKTGNGTVTVAKADTVAKAGEVITYTITPDTGSYIKDVTYDEKPIPAFDASTTKTLNITAETAEKSKNLDVIFADYEESAPVLMVSPFKFKEGDSTYLFMKLLSNNVSVSEYGIVMSTTAEEPTAENAEVLPFRSTLQQYGYYGFKLINKTGVPDQTFYVRPYAKVGNDYVYGNILLVEPANI